jgi:hypothetical protein
MHALKTYNPRNTAPLQAHDLLDAAARRAAVRHLWHALRIKLQTWRQLLNNLIRWRAARLHLRAIMNLPKPARLWSSSEEQARGVHQCNAPRQGRCLHSIIQPPQVDLTHLLQLAEDGGEVVGVLIIQSTHLNNVLMLLRVPCQLLVAEAAGVLCKPLRVALPNVLYRIRPAAGVATAGWLAGAGVSWSWSSS